MLNRRLLRSKVVQALYANEVATESNRLLALDEIAEAYKPDLNSMEPQNLEKLEGLRQLASFTLNELIQTGSPSTDEEVPFEVIQTAREVYKRFTNAVGLDQKKTIRRVLAETEAIYEEFLLVLQLLLELAHQAKLDRARVYEDPDNVLPKESGLDSNAFVKLLASHKPFQDEVLRKAASWSNHMEVVWGTYKEVLRKDETYHAYCRKNVHTEEEDQQLAQYVLRTVILKSPLTVDFFEQKDLYWEDHSELIRSMAIRTLKSPQKEGEFKLATFTDDWEDDRQFVEELYTKTLANDREYEEYLKEQLKNWDTERVALVDMLIMKAALTELLSFPGIPVKVTINEFIETAKRYSTPQSGKFVNGVLDVLAQKLINEQKIRKSGRGLIDNR